MLSASSSVGASSEMLLISCNIDAMLVSSSLDALVKNGDKDRGKNYIE